MSDIPFQEKEFQSADELWDALRPTNKLVKSPGQLIYRGQENAEWGLIPSVLRRSPSNPATIAWDENITADRQVSTEIVLLETFAGFCDQVGVKIPNDSLKFRKNVLAAQRQTEYFTNPQSWPNPALIEVMALAQQHGVPTRLLDWTKNPYAAVYFAASGALSNVGKWGETTETDKLAVWVLNTDQISPFHRVTIVQPPGAISPHLAAQAGLFTVHPHGGGLGEPFNVIGLEHQFSILPDTPLMKLTIPVQQSARLNWLCAKIGITGASIFPGADGAGRAVMDTVNSWAAARHSSLYKAMNQNIKQS